MHAALVALVFAVWANLSPALARARDAHAVADALAAAVERQAAPATGESHAVDAAVLALYAALESHLDTDAVSYDPLAGGGMSCGMLQQRCPFVWRSSLEEQARALLWDVRHSSLADVDSSPSRARRRLERARDALRGALGTD